MTLSAIAHFACNLFVFAYTQYFFLTNTTFWHWFFFTYFVVSIYFIYHGIKMIRKFLNVELPQQLDQEGYETINHSVDYYEESLAEKRP